MKKQYLYPKITISSSEEDFKMVKELREKYFINISAFFREKIKELYLSKKNENSKII